jgi:hypothetical protein
MRLTGVEFATHGFYSRKRYHPLGEAEGMINYQYF